MDQSNHLKKNIVIISLRGGMDGLAAVPVSDPLINRYRSELILNKKLKINSDFSLHPKLKTLHNLWPKNLATVIPSFGKIFKKLTPIFPVAFQKLLNA